MAQYTIGEVEELTGIKSHILRYWEDIIPSLAPKKNIGGRRVYSSRNVQILLRLNYLINTKKYTIEGAYNRIIDETALLQKDSLLPTQELIQEVNIIKDELLSLLSLVQKKSFKDTQ